MAGRKPKPTAIHKLNGNPGRRKLNDKEPTPEIVVPEIPEYLTDEAKKEWKRITPELERLGLISEIDRAGLAAYCQAYGRWVEAEKMIAQKGFLYKTKNDNITTSPLLWVSNKAFDQMNKMLVEFGMTPSSRSRISISTKGKDELDDFIKRKEKTKPPKNVIKVA